MNCTNRIIKTINAVVIENIKNDEKEKKSA